MSRRATPPTGGETGLYDLEAQAAGRRGVFALYPAMSPKYNTRPGHDEETMARLLIPVPKSLRDAWDKAKLTLPSSDTMKLASVLGYWGEAESDKRSYNRGYIDFLLQRAQENYQEKFQVSELQGDNYTSYFFGQKAPVFQYTGILLNTMQDDWRKAMTLIYLHLLRGTQLARRKLTMAIAYDEMVVVGSMINLGQVFTSDRQIASDFSFSILVKKIQFKEMHSYPTQVRTNIGYIKLDELMGVQVEDVKRSFKTISAPPSGQTTEERHNIPLLPLTEGYEYQLDENKKAWDDMHNAVSPIMRNALKVISLGALTD